MASIKSATSKRIGAPKTGFKHEVIATQRNVNTPVSRPQVSKSVTPIKTINQQGQTRKQATRAKRSK